MQAIRSPFGGGARVTQSAGVDQRPGGRASANTGDERRSKLIIMTDNAAPRSGRRAPLLVCCALAAVAPCGCDSAQPRTAARPSQGPPPTAASRIAPVEAGGQQTDTRPVPVASSPPVGRAPPGPHELPTLVATELSCPTEFPRGYRFVGSTNAERRQLFRFVWLDGDAQPHRSVATDPGAPDAKRARCIAIGPHRALNTMNWCCR